MGFSPAVLGRSGLEVGRIGLGSGYGIGARDVERAFDHGINVLYWGSYRRKSFGQGIRAVARRRREALVAVVQSYSRVASAVGLSLELALRRLHIEYADVLLLGWWNAAPPEPIVDAALSLREAGKVRHIMISGHHRPTLATLAEDPCYDAVMVRYNAAHRGAEGDVLPLIARQAQPPGVVTYTATSWGQLIDPALVPGGEPVPTAADCYRFALSHPQVNMCMSGPRNGLELEGALQALERGPMDDDELAWMRRVGDSVAARGSTDSLRVMFTRNAQGAAGRARARVSRLVRRWLE